MRDHDDDPTYDPEWSHEDAHHARELHQEADLDHRKDDMKADAMRQDRSRQNANNAGTPA